MRHLPPVLKLTLTWPGCRRARRVEQAVGMDNGAKDDAECAICRQYVHLAAVECDCCPGRRTCLRHAAALCECAPERWRLAFRHSLGELEAVAEEVAARVPAGVP